MIRFDNLTLGYDRHPAVHHLTGDIDSGALLAVVGPNGAGKSTLLRAIAGLSRPLDGRLVRVDHGPRNIGYLPQAAAIDRGFPISAFDLASSGLWYASGAFGGVGTKARGKVAAAMATVGLDGFESRWIGSLSGGQLQRLLFARLMLQDADLIVLDEPFNALDAGTTQALLALVAQWHREGRTVIAALHDLAVVRAHFPETLLLARRPIAWGRTAEVLTAENLAAAAGMHEAFGAHAPACDGHAASRAA